MKHLHSTGMKMLSKCAKHAYLKTSKLLSLSSQVLKDQFY